MEHIDVELTWGVVSECQECRVWGEVTVGGVLRDGGGS